MTPELKTACELVFQEHKTSSQIKWNRDSFRGRISIGLSEMAKETLVRTNIIFSPDKSKKIITLLNPAVATATSFEEAKEIIENKEPALITSLAYDPDTYITDHVFGYAAHPVKYTHQLVTTADKFETPSARIKWYMKPFFYYVVWPICALAAGALVTFLIDLAQTKLFLNLK
jgi:hypothetical protein